jgi:hypothetical protein
MLAECTYSGGGQDQAIFTSRLDERQNARTKILLIYGSDNNSEWHCKQHQFKKSSLPPAQHPQSLLKHPGVARSKTLQ